MRAYCSLCDFDKRAQDLVKSNGIDLVIRYEKEEPNGEELIELMQEYDILIINVVSKFTSEMIKYVKKPLIIGTDSVGVDHIAQEFFESELVKVVNIKKANCVSVAEHIFSLILCLNKRIFESNMLVLEGRGSSRNISERPDDISNKTLGLIGAGNISKEVLKISCVFNMNIICYTKNSDKHKDMLDRRVVFGSLDELLMQSDIVCVNIPLNNETKGLISEDKIKLLKKNATFINTSRAEVVDLNSLIKYADTYETFYVGLDIDLNNYKELFNKRRNNVVVTPHIAGVSKQAIERMDMEITNNIINIL